MEILKKRKSCRIFDPDIVIPPEDLQNIVLAASNAPYASGGPRYRIIPVVDAETKKKLYKACMGQPYVRKASALIVFCGTDSQTLRQGDRKEIFDVSAACMVMDLAATSMGYQTCWIGNFMPSKTAEILQTFNRPIIILLIGREL